MTAGEIALIVLAAFWALLVVALVFVSTRLFRVLDTTSRLLDEVREQTVPLLGDVRTTVQSVNKELERTDVILSSAGNITRRAERVTGLVDEFVSQPLIKAISFAAGVNRGIKRFRGDL
ncbi:MAG TPA: DUF948 domain-containing protein [Actinomycetota bacterium]|nr:DUF948 domain-containing protein [Actinomycetota bacterium]